MSGRAALGLAVLGGLACGERATPPPATASARPAPPADSLVLTAPGGEEIWFTLSRSDSGDTGPCTARTVEIRRGVSRVPVPLLYTTEAPALVNDSTIRAHLSDHCRPGDSYLVNLRSGRPVRERR